MKRTLLAEFFGTFVLTLAILMAIQNTEVGLHVPLIAALVLGLSVYSIGPISGCHINPAVTIGLYTIGRISLFDASGYVIAQFAASATAMLVAGAYGSGLPATFLVGESSTGFAGEFVGTTLFTFGIASCVFGKTPDQASGLVVGGSLFLGISVASLFGAAGILNPAVALATGSISLANIAGMLLGAVIGMNLYSFLQSTRKLAA